MYVAFEWHSVASLALSTLAVVTASATWALEVARSGYLRTGEGVCTRRVAFVNVHLFTIRHEMRRLPPARTRQAFIEADVDKRFTLHMLRDLQLDHARESFRDAFLVNGYAEAAKIRAFLSALATDLKAGTHIVVSYDASRNATTMAVEDGPAATVVGVDFMKAVWSIWFGKADYASVADALLGRVA